MRVIDFAITPTKRWFLKDALTTTDATPKRSKPEQEPTERGRNVKFTIYNQIPSGKNRIIVTRDGRRIPDKRFLKWRADAAKQMFGTKLLKGGFTKPVALSVTYTPGDLRTRDVTGMADALFSLLAWTGVVKDDGLIRELHWTEEALNRSEPRVEFELRQL